MIEPNLFTAVDKNDDVKVYFGNEVMGYHIYRDGILNRARSIGKIYFLHKVPFRKNDCVVDCGANNGDLKLWFNSNNLEINYEGFEPSPVEFCALKNNVGSARARNIGLWNTEGNLQFYISSNNGDSSLIEPEKYDKIVDVKTKRLEDVISGPVRLLKLEAEGAEPEILQGAGRALQQIDYVSVDMGYERGKTCESTTVDCVNFLLSNGFELIDMSHDRIVGLFKRKKCD